MSDHTAPTVNHTSDLLEHLSTPGLRTHFLSKKPQNRVEEKTGAWLSPILEQMDHAPKPKTSEHFTRLKLSALVLGMFSPIRY